MIPGAANESAGALKNSDFDTPGLIYAASARQADLLYLTSLFTEDPFLWLSPESGLEYVLISELETSRARGAVPAHVEVLSFPEARRKWGISDSQATIADYILAISRFFGIDQWQTPSDFPLKTALELQKKNLSLQAVDSPFCQARKCKSEKEIEQIKLGVRLAEHGFYVAEDILKESSVDAHKNLVWRDERLTSERLRGEINAEIIRCGGAASRTIAACGTQSAAPHECGSGPIIAEQPLVIDIFPRLIDSGYHGDFSRTLVKGRVEDVIQDAYTAVQAAKERGIQAVKSGKSGREAHQAAADTLAEHGFRTGRENGAPCGFFHGLGHGVGLEVHEKPSLSPNSQDILTPGNVITVEPGLYYPSWGGVRLEDVVVVTDEGCDNLTVAPCVLEVD